MCGERRVLYNEAVSLLSARVEVGGGGRSVHALIRNTKGTVKISFLLP